MSGHTFRFHWTVQDLEVFLVKSNLLLALKRLSKSDEDSDSNYGKTIRLIVGILNTVKNDYSVPP